VQSVAMQATRHARRIYVGGLGQNTEKEIEDFFNGVLTRALGRAPPAGGTYVINVYMNHERRFAFVEFGSIALTTACMQLDGILFNGQPLKVKRPNDYTPSMVPPTNEPVPILDMSALGVVSTTVPDGPNKVFVGGLPYDLSAEQIKELLSAFGPLKAFHLVKDAGAMVSKGYGFCEWADPSVTDKACESLNNMAVCGKTLTVRRAVGIAEAKAGLVGAAMPPAVALASFGLGEFGMAAGLGGFSGIGPGLPPVFEPATPVATRVLVLSNMVTPEELVDDEEFEDIVADVRNECAKFGTVKAVVIPRGPPGVGKVFVEFGSAEECRVAQATLHGRMFAQRKVIADYMSEAEFAAKDFSRY